MFNKTLLTQILAITFSAISGTINLVVAVAILPFWQSLEPEAFLDWFDGYARIFGSMSAPVTVLAIIFTGRALLISWNSNTRRLWLFAVVFIIASLLVFPLYFMGTNNTFYDRTIPLDQVASEVQTWSQWHWSRTITPFMAVLLSLWATVKSKIIANQ